MRWVKNALLVTALLISVGQFLVFTTPGRAIAGGIQHVIVDNATANPVPVLALDTAPTEPFQTIANLSMLEGTNHQFVTFTVPAGKRLVIETLSANVDLPADQTASASLITCNPCSGGVEPNAIWNLVLIRQGEGARFVATHAVRLYEPPSSTMFFIVDRSGTIGFATASLSVSGYLVNAP